MSNARKLFTTLILPNGELGQAGIFLSGKGIRLDELSPEAREQILRVLEVSLSPEGYQKAIGAMRINGFLGELVKSPSILNEFPCNFIFSQKPSTNRPWGISFYGHYLCLNIFFYKTQIIIRHGLREQSPT
jgi:Protein of unknown function (DUF3500)